MAKVKYDMEQWKEEDLKLCLEGEALSRYPECFRPQVEEIFRTGYQQAIQRLVILGYIEIDYT